MVDNEANSAKQAAQANLVRAAQAELVAKQVELREDSLRKVRRKQAVGSCCNGGRQLDALARRIARLERIIEGGFHRVARPKLLCDPRP